LQSRDEASITLGGVMEAFLFDYPVRFNDGEKIIKNPGA
jgi:hypothetical protein